MSRALRRTSLVLMWLMLALLPLRGWANLAMHPPAPTAPAVAPCHGEDTPAAADPAVKACTLCDVCHGAVLALAGAAPLGVDPRSQALPASLSAVAPEAAPDGLFRPPRR